MIIQSQVVIMKRSVVCGCKQTSESICFTLSLFGHKVYLLVSLVISFSYLTGLFVYSVLSTVTFKALEEGDCV